ncbi:DEAD/DEAH box helicase [Rhodobacter capsulatus]|uniref:DEAD/DEAH box helicase n=1 Tax=Rhodobacter capsulatus TaxID=1061 RepID=UPI0006DCCD3A|nr:DEAD/DEAH box helicase [Rhodobacter capsulatus]KQB15305.1 helicase [Rhodobacter capsulatus]KQB16115.1 helicase [Rhodobacter capsulatus]PZX25571.1 helicase-like protein [Rhodobacter capsulatus]QNR63881.1 DEAD/DEAH box helicase [Rhodobacter capsulatus]
MIDLAAQPPSFEAMATSVPDGFSVSERILEPVILIGREDGRIQVRLGGRRVVRGEEKVFVAPSPGHAWVADGNVLRPIPADAPALLSRMLGGEPAENISYPTAIRLLRACSDEIAVQAAPDVLHAGKLAAEELSAEVDIPGLHADLFPYQARGVQWMWETVNRTGGLILADEMGLGKTLQIIALLLLDPPEKTAPALIVCPTSLIANWVREFQKFAPGISIMVHRGAHRAGIYRDLQVASVVITTYETMVNDVSIFSSFEWSWVICDEAQAIKNPHSNRRKAIVTIPRRHSIPMTGTPVENTLLDLWSLADFAIPGMLGDRTVFEAEFPDTVEAGKALGALTDPVILKRRVRDVAADLPERIDIDLPVELDDRLARHYDDVREATLQKYPVAGALVATLQLQLVCAHPWLRVPDAETADWDDVKIVTHDELPLITPKMERVIDLLREAFQNGRKVIVFALFNRIGDLLRQACKDFTGVHWGAINGSTPQQERQAIVDAFTEFDGAACLVLNPKAAGAGLNITAATVVIHFTPVWNPALEAQASARAHRRGQTEPVTIYRLFYKNTVEEVMLERSAWKSDLANETVPVSSRDADDLKRALEISPVRT